MRHTSSITIAGPSAEGLTVFLEPSGDVLFLAPGGELRVDGEAEEPGEFELEYEEKVLTITAWRSAVVRWYIDGEERTAPAGPPPGPTIASAAAGDPQPVYAMWMRAEGKRIEVQFAGDVDAKALRALGGKRQLLGFGTWSFPGGGGDRAEATLLGALRDLGIAFVGAGPSPLGEVFEYAREAGLGSGSYRKISWRGPGD